MNPLKDIEVGMKEEKEEGSQNAPSAPSVRFENISVTVKVPKTKNKEAGEDEILKLVTCNIKAGKLTALMGSSGAGKTTLLNVLAGRASGTCTGQVLLNGESASSTKLRNISSYVTQVRKHAPIHQCSNVVMPSIFRMIRFPIK